MSIRLLIALPLSILKFIFRLKYFFYNCWLNNLAKIKFLVSQKQKKICWNVETVQLINFLPEVRKHLPRKAKFLCSFAMRKAEKVKKKIILILISVSQSFLFEWRDELQTLTKTTNRVFMFLEIFVVTLAQKWATYHKSKRYYKIVGILLIFPNMSLYKEW